MKAQIHYILSLIFLLIHTAGMSQQNILIRESSNNLKIQDNELLVEFNVVVPTKLISTNQEMVIYPVLINKSDSLQLQAIEFMGEKYQKFAQRKDLFKNKSRSVKQNSIQYKITDQQEYMYNQKLKLEPWMDGARISVYIDRCGCSKRNNIEKRLLAASVLASKPPVIQILDVKTPAVETPKISRVDQIIRDKQWTMLYSMADFKSDVATQPVINKNGRATIEFRISSVKIDSGYRANHNTLHEIDEIMKLLKSDKEYGLSKVMIQGYASPDGPFKFNNELAHKRAAVLINYLKARFNLDDSYFQNYPLGENWSGLRALVEASDLPERDEVLRIIDHEPDSKRKAVLMRLKGGSIYRTLLKDYFPKLRVSTCIRFYYDKK